MASIYDFLPPGAREQAAFAGLTQLGSGLIQGGAPSLQPGGGMRGLGLGLGGFNQGYQGSINSAVQQGMLGSQMADAQRKREQEEQMRQAQARLTARLTGGGSMARNPQMASADPNMSPGAPPVDMAALLRDPNAFADVVASGGGDPLKAMALMQKDDKPIAVAPGASLVDPRTYKPMFTAPKDQPPSEFEKALGAAGYQPGSPEYLKAARDYVARKGQPMQVINDLKQEGAEAKKVGDFYGDQFADWQKGAMTAPGRLGKLDRLDSLLSKAYTGTGAGTVQATNKALKAAGDAMGLDTSGLTEKVGSAEAAQALANEMALQLRNPAGGAGMPGAMSDKDREFLQSMVPGLGATAEGRKQIIETQRKLIKREQEVAKMARDYRRKNGHIDEGFFNELEAWSSKNEMFAGMQAPQQAAAPAANPYSSMSDQQILDNLRKQGVLK